MAFVPSARTITVDLRTLSGEVTARWYDPTNGTFKAIGDGRSRTTTASRSPRRAQTPTAQTTGYLCRSVLTRTNRRVTSVKRRRCSKQRERTALLARCGAQKGQGAGRRRWPHDPWGVRSGLVKVSRAPTIKGRRRDSDEGSDVVTRRSRSPGSSARPRRYSVRTGRSRRRRRSLGSSERISASRAE